MNQMRLAQTRPGRPFQIRAGFAQYDPGLLSKKPGTESDARSGIRHVTIRPDSGCTLAVMAITGRNRNACELDPAGLLGRVETERRERQEKSSLP